MLIEIKNRYNGVVLFAHDVAVNTVAITLAAALSSGANLREANLYGANLYGANLREANLYGANLYGANLREANLYGANLREANLRGANLYGANLCEANLREADLRGANLYGANLREAKNVELVIAQTRIIPDSGDIVGYKKCKYGVVVKLLIKEGVKRCHAMGRKCRAERAEVLEIYGASEAVSNHDGKTKYIVGETVVCDKWGEDWTVECSGGIHFFITRIEAENY